MQKKEVKIFQHSQHSRPIHGLSFCGFLQLQLIIFILFFFACGSDAYAQLQYSATHEDSTALEHVYVEEYYAKDRSDYTDSVADPLEDHSVTYRIYIDMKPGYSLQTVFGNGKHQLFIRTSSRFYNDQVCMAETGFNIDAKRLHEKAVALDSWITMGAASRLYAGIPVAEDNDGFSFITNRKSLSKVDGLTKAPLQKFQPFNLDLAFFNNDSTASDFSTSNGGWAALGGIKGPTPENRVLIAQLTTTGKLTFELNVQLGTPGGGTVQFVAKNPEGKELFCNELSKD